MTNDLTIPSMVKTRLRFINMGYEAPRLTLGRNKPDVAPYATDVPFCGYTGFVVVNPDTVTLRATGAGARLWSRSLNQLLFRWVKYTT